MARIVSLIVLQLMFGMVARAQTTKPTTAPSSPPATKPAAQPADAVLQQMLRPGNSGPQPLLPVPNPPVLDQTTGKIIAAAPGGPLLIREGDYVRDRTGRLTRSADGQLMEFTFDSDGQSLQDPPMVILPNLKLMAMENAVSGSSRDLRFRITGQVTEYKGRNYVLLEKVVVVPDVTQQF